MEYSYNMMTKITKKKRVYTVNWEKVYSFVVFFGVLLTIILMYVRCFYGTELSDEAYYVSEAKEIINGNIPFAYNNSSKALGFTFLLIPIIKVYSVFVPNLEGIFLVTRLCFVTFKVIISSILYLVFQKSQKRYNALLLVGVLIPLFGYFQNFNYNNVPIWLLLLSGLLLYDVIEQDAKYRRVELICAGFSTGIAIFANPGWGLTLFIFGAVIFFEVKDRRKKVETLLYYFGAVFGEVVIVIVPIVIKTSFAEVWYGFYRLFINKIPVDSLDPDKSYIKVIMGFFPPLLGRLAIMGIVTMIIYFFSTRYICENESRLTRTQYKILAFTIALATDMIFKAYRNMGTDVAAYWAFTVTIYLIVFYLSGLYKQEKILWYLGVYPLVFVIAEIVLVDYNAGINRFSNAITIIIPLLYVLLKQESELTRGVATALAVAIIFFTGYADFGYVYRDDDIRTLNYKVESGVYKGIYTSAVRQKDLVELENYLNDLIAEDETYSFRDNVPFAYLMVHHGQVCELSTWDCLQYSYDRNSPALLFDYYQRRNMIPDWIVYIDYGRDEKLSIEDDNYRYNDWVDTYYNQVDDFILNETFYHVIVYKYNGSFDGNYQRWIDNYWNLVK